MRGSGGCGQQGLVRGGAAWSGALLATVEQHLTSSQRWGPVESSACGKAWPAKRGAAGREQGSGKREVRDACVGAVRANNGAAVGPGAGVNVVVMSCANDRSKWRWAAVVQGRP
jgi:hypothetical protein